MAIPVSRTNNATDGAGSILGIERDNIIYVVLGILISSTVAIQLNQSGVSLVISVPLGGAILALVCLWVFGFKQGKPPAYDVDFIENLLTGTSWDPEIKQPRHPLDATEETKP